MFGKLTLADIPYQQPIIMGAVGFMIFSVLAILVAITAMGRWKWLWSEWLTSVDHKKIGIMYIIVAIVMLLRGFADAIMMRGQQMLASTGVGHGYLPPEHFDQVFSAHGVIMIFFMAMPFMVGLMNIAIPLQIGARDVAYPFLNSLSFWLMFVGVVLVNLSLGVGEFAQTGWLAYPPLSEKLFSPETGVDYWIWSLQISGIGTLLTGVNFIVTIMKMRAPGMNLMKMPVFTWVSLCANILIVAAFPVLTVVIALLTMDRYLGTHFFTIDGGGNQMMYINLIWIWGHPEVYILILPAFGMYAEIVGTFCKKRLFGYTSLVWATACITILAFSVWLHHFFTMGAGANVNAFFGIATMIISIPTGVKIFNWLFTMYRGRIEFSVPMMWTLAFLVTFVWGGMTGVLLAVPGADFVLHNSVFLIAHFHNAIIGGVVFGYLGGFAYWFPKATGIKINNKWGYSSVFFWTVGFFVAFVPLYILGMEGMPRRLNYDINPQWHTLLIVAAGGAVLILLGILSTVMQIVTGLIGYKKNADVTGDPWEGRTLEWATDSPPAFYNFAHIPHVKDRDAFWDMKQDGKAFYTGPFEDIHMPKNTAAGVIIAAFSLAFGFAMIWDIWWLAIVGLVGIVATWIGYSFEEDDGYIVPAAEVEKIEMARYEKLLKAGAIPREHALKRA